MGAVALAAIALGVAWGSSWALPAHRAPTAHRPSTPVGAPVSAPSSVVVGAHAIPCLDLPVSSALIQPDSCWQTGPTAMLIAGTSPGHPGQGAVAVIRGQAQSLAQLPRSGRLTVAGASATSGCVLDQHGRYHAVSLTTGAVATQGGATCGRPPAAATVPASSTLAQTVANTQPLTTTTAGVVLPPPVTPSYYEWAAYLSSCGAGATTQCVPYQQGRATYTSNRGGIVVLDMGAPCYVPGTAQFGAQMFGEQTCTADATLKLVAQAWIRGYESDHGAGTTDLTLALGTSNSLTGADPPTYALTAGQMKTSGSAWYTELVGAVSTSGLAAPITMWGASDMEQAGDGNWYGGNLTVDWVDGFQSASPDKTGSTCPLTSPGLLADYGDDVLGGSGSAYGWTAAQVYQVSWGMAVACALPEIYYQGMASEWQALSQSGATPILFSGVMAEAASGAFTPTQAWGRLQTDTNQNPPIPALTQIGTALQGQPAQISGLSPNQGWDTGGTQVVISGSNFQGTQAVYFGSVRASTVTVNSSTKITVVAPPSSPGFVEVSVETSQGASSSGLSARFQYVDPCSSISVSLAATAVLPGYPDTVSANATCPAGGTVKYSYFTRAGTSGPWRLRAAWIGASWTWPTAGLPDGTYQVLVWASDGPYTKPQIWGTATLNLGPPPPCTGLRGTASPSSLYTATPASVVITANPTCPQGTVPKYSYFTRAGTTGPWHLRAAWIGPTWTWSAGALPNGTDQILVWVSDGPYAAPQAEAVVSVRVAPPPPCSAASATAQPDLLVVGTTVTVNAGATCPSGTLPKYSYFTRAGTSGAWHLRAAWIGPTWQWPTTGLPNGTDQVLVWASDGPYTVPQAQAVAAITVGPPPPCTAITVSAQPSSATAGTSIAVSASATCPSGTLPKYSYFTRAGTSGRWTLRAAWIGPTWTWPTGGLAAGTYQVLVWASDGPYTVYQVEGTAQVQLAS